MYKPRPPAVGEALSTKTSLLRTDDHPYNENMDHELHNLLTELSKVFGRLTRYRRFCAERQTFTTDGQIAVAREVLKIPISGSISEARWEEMLLRRAFSGLDEPGVVEIPYTQTGY